MKHLWIFVVLSAVAFGQNAYGPDYLNLHCTTPDIGGNASFGDFPRAGLAPSSSVNGTAVIYCDASTGSLKASFNGNAYTGIGGGTISPNNTVAGALTFYAAAGGSTTVSPDANLSDSGGILTSASSIVPSGTVQLGTGANRWNTFFTVTVQASGNITAGGYQLNGTQLISGNVPTIAGAGCGGSAASIPVTNGTGAFKINVGTAPGSACTITMPAATTGWNCHADDITTQSASVFVQKQTGAESTTSVTITNFNTSAAATAYVASDILKVTCAAD